LCEYEALSKAFRNITEVEIEDETVEAQNLLDLIKEECDIILSFDELLELYLSIKENTPKVSDFYDVDDSTCIKKNIYYMIYTENHACLTHDELDEFINCDSVADLQHWLDKYDSSDYSDYDFSAIDALYKQLSVFK
jgi:hypothetical protein